MRLELQAYKNRHDFDRMAIRGGVVFGSYKLQSDWVNTRLDHIDDISISIENNGNRIVRDHTGFIIFKFGPKS